MEKTNMETIKNNRETNMLNHEIEASFILTAQSAGNLMSFDYSAWEKGNRGRPASVPW